MPVDQLTGLVTLYDNAGVILGFIGAILGGIAHLFHRQNKGLLGKVINYINEAHDFNTNNHDRFVGLVQAATDVSPELKQTLEAHGADINKVVADSEVGKLKLKQILDEINSLADDQQVKK